MSRRREDRESYWRGIVERQVESGLSVADFCRQESISTFSLYGWRRKLRGREADQRPKNRRTDRVDVGAVSAAQLLPVRIESPGRSPHVRVLLPHGVSLDVSYGSDASALTMVLRALREVQLC